MRYYKIETEEYITTRNVIPEDMLEKKGLLLVVKERVKLEEGTTPKEESGKYIEKDKVRDVLVEFFHVDTLDEAKEKKVSALKQYISPKFPPVFKQLNTLFGEYGVDKGNSIKKQVKDMRAYIDGYEIQILAAKDFQSLEAIDYVMEEDKIILGDR